MGDEQYELVNTRDWAAAAAPNGDAEGNEPHHEYSLPGLDADWFPVVASRLRDGAAAGKVSKTVDEPDFAGGNRKKDFRSQMDEIDGRGTFDAAEMEDELRAMGRAELEDRLGISAHKVRKKKYLKEKIKFGKLLLKQVREILRRADIHRNGQIEYRVFLETVQRYRLSTEQVK